MKRRILTGSLVFTAFLIMEAQFVEYKAPENDKEINGKHQIDQGVRKDGPDYYISTIKGDTVFKDFTDPDDPDFFISYVYHGYYLNASKNKIFLINKFTPDHDDYILLNAATGKWILMFSRPVLSPEGRMMADARVDWEGEGDIIVSVIISDDFREVLYDYLTNEMVNQDKTDKYRIMGVGEPEWKSETLLNLVVYLQPAGNWDIQVEETWKLELKDGERGFGKE